MFDLLKMSWIGKASSDPRVMIVSANNKTIKTFNDLLGTGEAAKIAVSGVGAGNYNETQMLMHALKLITTLFKVNIQQELAYRADAMINALLSLMWLGWELLSLNIIFNNTATLGDTRRAIARAKTILAEKQRAAAK